MMMKRMSWCNDGWCEILSESTAICYVVGKSNGTGVVDANASTSIATFVCFDVSNDYVRVANSLCVELVMRLNDVHVNGYGCANTIHNVGMLAVFSVIRIPSEPDYCLVSLVCRDFA